MTSDRSCPGLRRSIASYLPEATERPVSACNLSVPRNSEICKISSMLSVRLRQRQLIRK